MTVPIKDAVAAMIEHCALDVNATFPITTEAPHEIAEHAVPWLMTDALEPAITHRFDCVFDARTPIDTSEEHARMEQL